MTHHTDGEERDVTEKEYDEVVAPMLLSVAHKCEEMGMSLVARVSWGDGAGTTQIGDMDTAQRLTQIAAHSGGNIDALLIQALREFDCSRSAILHQFTQPVEAAPHGKTRTKTKDR